MARDPEWMLPEYPSRVVFAVPRNCGRHILVRIPVDKEAGSPAFVATDSKGAPVSCVPMLSLSNETFVLVAAPADTNAHKWAVYYSQTNSTNAFPVMELPADALPVRIELRRSAWKAVPNSWQKMMYLFRNSGRGNVSFIADFQDTGGLLKGGEQDRKDKDPKSRLAQFHSIMVCPTQGLYRFALDCVDAGFLLVDGELAVAWPGEHQGGAWRIGDPVNLSAGAHAVDMYNMCRDDLRVEAGWMPPGSSDVMLIQRSSLLGGVEPDEVRIERSTQALQASFSADLMQAYSLRGSDAVFVPVRFKDTSESWLKSAMQGKWSFGDGREFDLKSTVHVYGKPGCYRVVLDVTDSLGFVGRCERVIDCRLVQPKEYAISGDVVAIPAVCYESDLVEPVLVISGIMPRKIDASVSWEIRNRDGTVKRDSRELNAEMTSDRIPLVRTNAGVIASIKWQITHPCGELISGTVKFLRPPFTDLPTRVAGDRLYGHGGEQLVLLPYENAGSFVQPGIAPRGVILCVDDTGIATISGTSGEICLPGARRLSLQDDENSMSAYAPQYRLLRLPSDVAAGKGVAVMNIACVDIIEKRDPAEFEREIAALSDIVSVTMKSPLVWMTPPPYQPDPKSVRPYAAAVVRVAAARGIPVADVYTAFMCSKDSSRFFEKGRNLDLSEEGRHLVERVIGHAITVGRKGNEQ
jgi:hypothetical protein